MALADVVDERQEPDSKVWADKGDAKESLKAKIEDLKQKSRKALEEQGFGDKSIVYEEYLNMRYRGTESALMVVKPERENVEKEFDGDEWAFGKAFVKQHQQEFGFTLPDRDIIVDDVRVRGIGKSFEGLGKTVDQQLKEIKPKEVKSGDKEYKRTKVYFEGGRQDTPIYKLEDLEVGDKIHGPAVLADGTQTIVVTPGASALIIETHVVINIGEKELNEKYSSSEFEFKVFQLTFPLVLQNSILPKKLTLLCLAYLPIALWLLPSKWVELFRRPVSARTSKSVSTTLVLFLIPLED